jgi:hypothetical protein
MNKKIPNPTHKTSNNITTRTMVVVLFFFFVISGPNAGPPGLFTGIDGVGSTGLFTGDVDGAWPTKGSDPDGAGFEVSGVELSVGFI